MAQQCDVVATVPIADDEAHRLILFVAGMCWNMGQGASFSEQIEGYEAEVLAKFREGVHPWDAVDVLPEYD